MNFQDLHERLRVEMARRIERGDLTGTELARQAGFKQAHVSNFLNRKRALSLEGLDRMLAAQRLTVDELLPVDLSAAAGEMGGAGAALETEAVPVVTAKTAMEDAAVRPGAVIETVQVAAASLRGNRWWAPEKYVRWERYVAVRADAQQAAAMEPVIAAGAIAVIDRHYRSLALYRAQQRTLYAVRTGSGLALRYVELDGANLVLRPLALAAPVQVLAVRAQETPADFLVGRVCVVVSEL
jgi:hypothetical protein